MSFDELLRRKAQDDDLEALSEIPLSANAQLPRLARIARLTPNM